jgi:serine/threonine protein kinase
MAHPEIQKWFRSHQDAQVNGIRVRPIQHPLLKEEPLSIQKGQAEATCLESDTGNMWILKKLFKNKGLARSYLVPVGSLLPRHEGFIAGTERHILSADKLARAPQCYFSNDLASFLDGTILMPRILGMGWSGLADDIRDGQVQLSKQDRIVLLRNLIALITILEKSNCCHRDLSSGNVFIDTATWKVYLIDFDSLYHPSLVMPKTTTCGTTGYIPPYAWDGLGLDAKRTWCPHADRYTLGLLVIEFCVMDVRSPLTADGGMFDQDELRRRSGPGIESVKTSLRANWPTLLNLFQQTIDSRNFDSCPSPQGWQNVLNGCSSESIRLDQMESIPAGYFQKILSRAIRPKIMSNLTPRLSDIPEFKVFPKTIILPPNPWK